MLASASSSVTVVHADSLTAACGRAAAACAPSRLPAAVGSRWTSASMNGVCRAVGVDLARGGQRRDDPPAQIGVDRQPGQAQLGGIVVEQIGQHRHVPRRQHRCAQRVDERQLMIRTRRRGAGQLQQPVGERRPALRLRPVRVGVGAQRGLRLQQQPLGDPDFGLGLNAARDQRHEIAGPQLGVAGHLPCRRPHQRSGQRFGDVGDAVQRGLQRLGVQPQRAVGQVVVVDQDQLAARNTNQRRHFRAFRR